MKFKVKANEIDENLHKALYDAAYYFKVDYDLLCNEWEENSEKYFEEFLDSI